MIGILSDTHDNLTMIRQALEIFRAHGCTLLIHAGDIVAPFAAKEFEAAGCPVKAVFGNCDGEKEGLRKAFQACGEISNPPLTFSHQGLEFLATHVHTSVENFVARGKYDVIIFGHTHRPEINKAGRTLLINPGETGGWLTGKSTIALFNPEKNTAEIITL